MPIIPYLQNWQNSLIHERRFVYGVEKAGPAEADTTREANETQRETQEAEEKKMQERDPDKYIEKKVKKLKAQVRDSLRGPNAREQIRELEEDINLMERVMKRKYGKERQEYENRRGGIEEKQEGLEEEAETLEGEVNNFAQSIERQILEKRIENNPELKEIYEALENNYGLSNKEKLTIRIHEVMESTEDPTEALKLANAAMFKEMVLSGRGNEPAKADELIDFDNRLGRGQIMQAFEYMDIDFDNLSISKEQMAKMEAFHDVLSRCDGMTYLELGLLDEGGKVQEDRLNELLEYEDVDKIKEERDEYETDRVEQMRNAFSSFSSVNTILIENIKEKHGGEGELPSITIEGREYDLNEIGKEHEAEYNNFQEIYEDFPEEVNEDNIQDEMPKRLDQLMNYRFDESNGVGRRIRTNGLPDNIKANLASLGLKNTEVELVYQGQIRRLKFVYEGEEMELSIGKSGWTDDKTPYIHIYNGTQKIQSRSVSLGDISNELKAAHEYKTSNQDNIDEINEKFFGIKKQNSSLEADIKSLESLSMNIMSDDSIESSYIAEGSIFSAKEKYLGSIKEPKASNLKRYDNQKALEIIEKVLPMIIANQAKLRITNDMSVMEAMVMIYNSGESTEPGDYISIQNELKNPNSRHYTGVKPIHYHKEGVQRDEIKEARKSKDPEYIKRKEKLAKMEKGEEISVEFEGRPYVFKLEDSLANYEYKFKLEGFENADHFTINNIDLLTRNPEEQLQHMLGTQSWRLNIESEKLLNEYVPPNERPKEIHLNHKFRKGEIKTHSYFKNLPLDESQQELLANLNDLEDLDEKSKFKLILSTNRYGKIDKIEVKWKDEDQTRYRLQSYSGEKWRLRTLEEDSSRPKYAFYDTNTEDVENRVEDEMEEK